MEKRLDKYATLNFLDAVKSGRKMRRRGWPAFKYFSDLIPCMSDVLAEDWELEPALKATITMQELHNALASAYDEFNFSEQDRIRFNYFVTMEIDFESDD